VCGRNVRGDRDVIEAHVDACLAHESRCLEIERNGVIVQGTQVSEDTEVDIDGALVVSGGGSDDGEQRSVRTRVITTASLRGTGIHVRTQTQDTEEDIDIDGTDDFIFGDPQFGEEDVVGLDDHLGDNSGTIDTDGKVGERSNHDRQPRKTWGSEGSLLSRAPSNSHVPVENEWSGGNIISDAENDRFDVAILAARKRGDHLTLIAALENKIKSIVRPGFVIY